jgi:hypothetical protein
MSGEMKRMNNDELKQEKRKRKLQTAWREEPLCPHCHGVVIEGFGEDGETYPTIDECPHCHEPVSMRVRTKTEFLILS